MKKILIGLGFLVFFLPLLVSAKVGIGTATGKIEVEQALRPGLIYTLPSFTIINTGDEASFYKVSVQWREDQEELRVQADWLSFEPEEFYLEPTQTQNISVRLSLPVRQVTPGDYFAFLQGFPVEKELTDGGTRVGVAAASKLYFTVEPANFFTATYYRISSFISMHTPWSYVVLAVILAALLVAIFRRFFSFNIGVSFKKK